jgi:N-acetylneuraminic acid mutarotase
MLTNLFLLVFAIKHSISMNAILLDGQNGKTQIYIPGSPIISMSNMSFGLPNFYGATAVMFNGEAYFIGGEDNQYYDTVTIFDPNTNETHIGSPLNQARAYFKATVVSDSIILCGGLFDTTILSSCETFNEITQKWEYIAPLPIALLSFGMVTLNGYAYVFGGRTEDTSDMCRNTGDVYKYNGSAWLQLLSMPHPLRNHAVVALDNDRALVCGGTSSKGNECHISKECHVYSAIDNKWDKVAPMAHNRSQHTMVVYNGVVVITVLKTLKCLGTIFIFGNLIGDRTSVEEYSLKSGGKILPVNVSGDANLAVVVVGKYMFSLKITSNF